MNEELYGAILARRSVRRFDSRPLGESLLDQVREIVASVRTLIPENQVDVLIKDVAPGEDLVDTFGGYGRILSPPHYLVPYATGKEHLLTELGYRVEQIVVRLTVLGLGTCYVGSIARDSEVVELFELPNGTRVGSFLAFGVPSEALGGRLFNSVLRSAVGATSKRAADQVFYQDALEVPSQPPAWIAPIIEAGRNAPSAVNAQPWHLLWQDPALYLFVDRQNRRYGGGAQNEYRLYDGGICMANISLAMEALGIEGVWQMLSASQLDLPDYPETLEPLAKLVLADGVGR